METFHGIGLWFAKKRADLVLLLYYNLDVLQVCHSLGVSAMGMAAKQTVGADRFYVILNFTNYRGKTLLALVLQSYFVDDNTKSRNNPP